MAQFGNDWATFAKSPHSLSAGTVSSSSIETDLAWGDLDLDGREDLVVVRKQPFASPGKRANLLLMNEQGVLTDRTTEFASAADVPGDSGFLTPTSDRDVVIGDVDGDGWPDVITATTMGSGDPKHIGHPRIYMNLGSDGMGNWLGLEYQEARIPQLLHFGSGLPINPWFCSVAIGDVTGDGAPDLYFGDSDSGGGGTQPSSADLDDRLLVNNGAGFFTDESQSRMTPGMLTSYLASAVGIADFNGNGRADVIKSTYVDNPQRVTISYNNVLGSGTDGVFDIQDDVVGGAPAHVGFGDLNNDGRLDVIVSDDGNDRYLFNVGVDLLNRAVFSSSFSYSFLSGGDDGFAGNCLIADLDGDGWPDALHADVDASAGGGVRRMHIYHNLGGESGAQPGDLVVLQEEREMAGDGWVGVRGMRDADLQGTHDVAVFDVDGDGLDDLVVSREAGTDVWLNLTDAFDFDGQPAIVDCVEPGALASALPPKFNMNRTPIFWQGDLVDWSGDQSPRNKIDDQIDASSDPLFDVIINYDHCVEAADLAVLQGIGHGSAIKSVYKYITSVAMSGLDASDIDMLAGLPGVAFIELDIPMHATIDVSVPSMGVSPGFYSPQTVEEFFGLTGAGVTIAIIDSGVNNNTPQHVAFQPDPYVGGHNVWDALDTDPDDDNGHGTHVASIALGRPFAAGRGVAPGAGLIDVKALDSNGDTTKSLVEDAIDLIYEKHEKGEWDVDVINMSIGATPVLGGSNGIDSLSQKIDRADELGISFVVTAGNDHPFASGFDHGAAATTAITVGGGNTKGTHDRSDDKMYFPSNRGPRADDNDHDCLDELKPEVNAPGQAINAASHLSSTGTVTLSGTSMAAPLVAGLVALIREADPDMSPAAIKDLIIRTAEPRASPTLPLCHPTWNRAWGYGQVNAFAALSEIAQGPDVGFPSHPTDPFWLSPDIQAAPAHPEKNTWQTITAQVRNHGLVSANDVRVDFGIDVLSGTPSFFPLGARVVDIPPQTTVDVSYTWKTLTKLSKKHYCAKVDVNYGLDQDSSNNSARRNYGPENSPVAFQVFNNQTLTPALIEFDVSCDEGDTTGWMVSLEPNSVSLSAEDCPEMIEAFVIPPFGTPDGEAISVHIATRMGNDILGGVTIRAAMHDCNGNGIDDYLDIVHGVSQDLDDDGVPDECDAPCGFDPYGVANPPKDVLHLVGQGTPALDSVASLVTYNVEPGALVLLVAALGQAALPFKGGTLYVDPTTMFVFHQLNADADGLVEFLIPIPDAQPLVGLELNFQTVSVLAGGGVDKLSNGLRLKICEG